MAIVGTHLTAATEDNASSKATSSYTPGADKLILAAVVSRITAATPNTPTGSGNGLTWVVVGSQTYNAVNIGRLTVFRAMGSSPTTGAFTASFGGQTQNAIVISIAEFDGVETGGTDGSDAIRQHVDTSGNSNSPADTLAAFASTDNATYAAVAASTSGTTVTPGSGFTELSENSIAFLGVGAVGQHQWRADNDTSVDATLSASEPWAILGAELVSKLGVGKRRLLVGVG